MLTKVKITMINGQRGNRVCIELEKYIAKSFQPSKWSDRLKLFKLAAYVGLSLKQQEYGSYHIVENVLVYHVYVCTHVCTYASRYLCIYLSTYLPTYVSIYLPIYLPTYLSIYLSTYLSIILPIYLSLHAYILPHYMIQISPNCIPSLPRWNANLLAWRRSLGSSSSGIIGMVQKSGEKTSWYGKYM